MFIASNKHAFHEITTLSRKKNDKIEMVATKNVNMYIYTHFLMKPDIVDILDLLYIFESNYMRDVFHNSFYFVD